MHILVTNDDGPPSNQSSPYVHYLIHTLQAAGHTVSVVLPHTQRSWIGKAHIVGHTVKPTYFRPGALRNPETGALHNEGITTTKPLPKGNSAEEWILIDSTPASCVQIGLYHFFQERGPVDLVISGPNYGRNTTAVFSLSSGTLGGALEGAVCGVKAIALSYAFFDRNHDPDIVQKASEKSVKVIEWLWANWKDDVHLYTVNTPLLAGVTEAKVLWTYMLQNRWTSGSCFQAIEVPEEEDAGPEEAEHDIREKEESGKEENGAVEGGHLRYKHIHFKWSPNFKDVYQSVSESEPGNDGWAVQEGNVSVTALRANFMHVTTGPTGEIKL